MKLDWYKQEAARTSHSIGETTITGYLYDEAFHESHMKWGICTEFGELIDVFKKFNVYGKVEWDGIDWEEKLLNEYGDLGWYCINWAKDLSKIVTEDDGLQINDPVIAPNNILDDYHCVLYLNGESALQAWIDIGFILGINHDEAMEYNIAKLKKRMPSKFDADLAKNKNEKNELEGLRRKAN